MNIVEFSTRRRVTVAMLMIAVIVFGVVGFSRLSVNLLPDITYPTITVRTEYPGVAPLEIERLISEPVEGLVGVVNNVVRVNSISRPGVSDVAVEFSWGTNMDFASLDLREKLDLGNLPRDTSQPILLRFDPSLDPIMRVAFYGKVGLMEMRRVAEERLRPQLESLEGVAAISIEGGLEEEIQVEVEISRLDHLKIPISQITSRLSAENVNITGGTLKDGEAEFLVRTLNEFKGIEEIGDIVIGEINNAPIKLIDVARIFRGHKERDMVPRVNGREGVVIAVFKEGDSNTVQVSQALHERLDLFFEENTTIFLKNGMQVVFDQATFINQAVEEVLNTAIIGGVLAILILFLFLRDLKSTSIIGLAIPISVVATFLLMYASDVSLNIMSLGGLALGIGMLVDNSIVVLESVQRYRDQGLDSITAARRGASEVGTAVVASTMTTICVFLPIVFVEGVAGQLFKDQALTVTYSLLASLVVALMLIPMLSSIGLENFLSKERYIGGKIGINNAAALLRMIAILFSTVGKVLSKLLWPIYVIFDGMFKLLSESYPHVLRSALRHRFFLICTVFSLAAIVFYNARNLGVELIPEMSQGEFLVDLEWKAGTPLEETVDFVEWIDRAIEEIAGVNMIFSLVGTSGQTGGSASDKKEHTAQLQIKLLDDTVEDQVVLKVREILSDFPGLEYKFSHPSYFSFRTPIEIEIAGSNIATLQLIADEVVGRIQGTEGLTDIRSSAEGGQPEIQIVFDRLRLAELGTTVRQVGQLLQNKLQGEVATELVRRDRKIDIRVRALNKERETLDDLKKMVVSPSNYSVPVTLENVASISSLDGPAEIRRIDQQRVAIVSGNIAGRDLGGVVRDIEKRIGSISLPSDFSISIGGQNEEMVRSFESMKFAIALAVFLVYLVMASQFESLLHPFVIMFTIPLGVVGSAFALMMKGENISVVVLIGLIMLSGIVVNNAIVLIDYVNKLRRNQSLSKIEAVIRAGQLRFRPIMMTTATTVLGLLPMAMGLGEGSEIRSPMAITVIGGLIVSTALTLVVIPIVYTIFDRGE